MKDVLATSSFFSRWSLPGLEWKVDRCVLAAHFVPWTMSLTHKTGIPNGLESRARDGPDVLAVAPVADWCASAKEFQFSARRQTSTQYPLQNAHTIPFWWPIDFLFHACTFGGLFFPFSFVARYKMSSCSWRKNRNLRMKTPSIEADKRRYTSAVF